MKYLTVILALILSACSSNPYVSLVGSNTPTEEIATVLIPDDILITRINDRKFNSMLGSNKLGYHLNAGIHSVELRYDELWEIDADNHEVVRSDIVKMEWALEAGKTYELKSDSAANLKESKALANNFSPWIIISNKTVAKQPNKKINGKSNKESITESYQLKQLKTWWARSSKQDQNTFKDWLSEQSKNKP